jgi:uncharacterized protein
LKTIILILLVCNLILARTQQYIEVSGTSTIEEKADMISWKLQLKTVSKELSDAKEKSDKIIMDLSKNLMKNGLSKKSLLLGNTFQGKDYEYSDNKRIFNGYHYIRDFTLNLDDISKFDIISDILTKHEDMEVHNIQYDIKDKVKMKLNAIKAAIKDAKIKAETIADELDVKLKKLLYITEEQLRDQSPRPYMMNSMELRSKSDASFSPQHLGSISVSYTAIIRFSIE